MSAAHWIPTSRETDRRCTSIKQAVRFARKKQVPGSYLRSKATGMCQSLQPTLWLRLNICTLNLCQQIQMPALIRTIKESGLILVSCGEANSDYKSIRRQEANGVDATVSQNVLKYNITGPTA
ncbi:hypothetical protein DFJ73DRAFT_332570 [Zopfochytrium polystomum]|nr:hypothetical protein DFJ73DRAFT_332570 [Zopfochytrium polystomum]